MQEWPRCAVVPEQLFRPTAFWKQPAVLPLNTVLFVWHSMKMANHFHELILSGGLCPAACRCHCDEPSVNTGNVNQFHIQALCFITMADFFPVKKEIERGWSQPMTTRLKKKKTTTKQTGLELSEMLRFSISFPELKTKILWFNLPWVAAHISSVQGYAQCSGLYSHVITLNASDAGKNNYSLMMRSCIICSARLLSFN